LPSAFNPPIDQDKLQAISASNPGFRDAIQGHIYDGASQPR
jgi:hypothetical protein